MKDFPCQRIKALLFQFTKRCNIEFFDESGPIFAETLPLLFIAMSQCCPCRCTELQIRFRVFPHLDQLTEHDYFFYSITLDHNLTHKGE